MFSRPPYIIRMLYTYRKCRTVSHAQHGFSPVVCRQLSLPPTFYSLLLWLCFSFSFSVVGGWLDKCFWGVVDFGLRACFPQLVELGNELARCFVGILRPPVLSLGVSGCCLIHDNPVETCRTSFLHVPATPHLWC